MWCCVVIYTMIYFSDSCCTGNVSRYDKTVTYQHNYTMPSKLRETVVLKFV